MNEWDPYEDAPLNPHAMAFRLKVNTPAQSPPAADKSREAVESPGEDVADQVARWDANSTYVPHEAEPNDPFELAFHYELKQARDAADPERRPDEMNAEDWDFYRGDQHTEPTLKQETPEVPNPPDPPWPFRKESDDRGYETIDREDDFGR